MLRRGYAGFIEEEGRCLEPALKLEFERSDLDFGTQSTQTVIVGIESTTTNLVSPGRMQVGPTGSVQKRCSKQERGSDSLAQGVGNLWIPDLCRANPYFTSLNRDGSTHVLQDVEHALDIQDARHIFKDDLLIRQQGSGHHGQCCVLVSAGRNLAS